MKIIAKSIGLLGLAGTIVPPFLFMLHKLDSAPMQSVMLVSCVAWFVTAPMWMRSE
ncbi:MAG: hypothetical protein SGI77_19945 [Pirellulaceae bacterium]|nr:hypothetical protein [Pirellulaceae bacterium]